ncbi:MAG TPA: DUF6250 domain-containing protein [Candidatus Didemnitutus sp.]|jgi:hypothetical protein
MIGRLVLLAVTAGITAAGADRPAIIADEFDHGLAQWVVEQQPGGKVAAADGVLRIDDRDGCTVWFRPCLTAPVRITYEARVRASGRVSDLNCFWMATDPRRPDDLFAPGHRRDGRFASYDSLLTYYVGCGGNDNTTTRFRRYDGTGARPLAPEFDRRDCASLLEGDRTYRIELVAAADGRVQFIRDGVVVFDFHDPQPLRRGWFGIRTVRSRIEIRHFRVASVAAP